MAVTIPGSTSVQLNCGNGQGIVNLTPGWNPYMWVFSSSNGQPCSNTLLFYVNGGAVQYVTAPW